MDKFGFIGHFWDLKLFEKYFPDVISKYPGDFSEEKIIEEMPPFLFARLKRIVSIDGKEIEGYIAVCPLLPKQFFELEEEFVLKKIIGAGQILKDLGTQIIGLGGFTSIVKDQGETITKALKVPVTTGNTYTSAAVIEAVERICKDKKVNLSKSEVSIIGATGSIGMACAKILAKNFAHVIITARRQDRLEKLKAELENMGCDNVAIIMDVKKAVRDSDVVVTTTSASESILAVEDFKSGVIICDVAVPVNVFQNNTRKDVTYFKGGIVELPMRQNLGVNIDLPVGLSYGCLAETMILTFNKRFEDFSGKDIPIQRVNEFRILGEKAGFKIHLGNIL